MLEILNHDQGSEEWRASRVGVLTASCFKDILAKGAGKTRRTYMLKLAGERITGNPMYTFSNDHVGRGHDQEETARVLYTEQTGNVVTKCGFLKRENLGYSPDGLVGDDGIIEIKTKLEHLQAEILLSDEIPSEHMAQIQGGLMISGRKWLDFVSYCPGMPLFLKRVLPDENYILQLEKELMNFEKELLETIEKLMQKF